MITNHDAAIIAEKDARTLHSTLVKSEPGHWEWPTGVEHVGPIKTHGVWVPGPEVEVTFYKEETKGYVDKNCYQYYILINTWIQLIQAHSEIGGDMVEDRIRAKGLLPVIAEASTAALQLIRQESPATFWATVTGELNIADSLFLLRFPKRFTVFAESLAKQREVDFKLWNHRMADLNRTVTFSPILRKVRKWMRRAFRYYPRSGAEIVARFSNGVSRQTGRALCDKIRDYSYSPNFGDMLYPNFTVTYDSEPERICRFGTVPKDYKSYRGIAVEETHWQARQQCVRYAIESALDKSVGSNIPLRNQLVNGIGCSDSDYATIDIHNASDGVSIRVFELISPDALYNDVVNFRSAYAEMPDGSRIKLSMVSTMGNGYTFHLESGIFWSIAMAATEEAALWLGKEISRDRNKFPVWAYGDDLRVPNWAYDTVCDWLEILGFVVNRDKSYSDTDPFRESCGHDWFDGEEVTSCYWPRTTVMPRKNDMPHLIALQNNLVERGGLSFYWKTTRFLSNQVKRIVPKISTVSVDELLEYSLQGKVLVGPVSETVLKEVSRPYGLIPGDGRSYSEEMTFVYALTPTFKRVWSRTKHYCHTVLPLELNINMYLYMEFLMTGPAPIESAVEYDIFSECGWDMPELTMSRFSRRITSVSDGFEITRIRLF